MGYDAVLRRCDRSACQNSQIQDEEGCHSVTRVLINHLTPEMEFSVSYGSLQLVDSGGEVCMSK